MRKAKNYNFFLAAKSYLAIAFKAAFDVDAGAPRATWVLSALQALILIFAPMMKNGFSIYACHFFMMI